MKAILVTGSNGGIGTAICKHLKGKGYLVIGMDISSDINNLDEFIHMDIINIVKSEEYRTKLSLLLDNILSNNNLIGLINNAAIQILSKIEDLDIDDFKLTMDTNVTAPLVLSKLTFSHLKANKGNIINIGSIHSKLTKPGFISYATSKSALLGLTQSLAVDCGEYVKITAIQPAATATDMLLDGFKENKNAFSILKSYHPSNNIGSPENVAEIVYFIISSECSFMNGSIIDLNGGIGFRLHDPA